MCSIPNSLWFSRSNAKLGWKLYQYVCQWGKWPSNKTTSYSFFNNTISNGPKGVPRIIHCYNPTPNPTKTKKATTRYKNSSYHCKLSFTRFWWVIIPLCKLSLHVLSFNFFKDILKRKKYNKSYVNDWIVQK